ncbi:MAG: AI-2E family transporter [Hyphomicrobiales bacterium]|nr:AI-2E family transporter [Hyphomicrobiales bacterium]
MSDTHHNSAQKQIVFWLLALAFFFGFLWVFRSILLPFVAGMTLAYFLDPVADFLERLGLSRMVSTVVIVISFILIFIFCLAIFLPLLVNQATAFAQHVPTLVARLQKLVMSTEIEWLRDIIGDGASQQDAINKVLGKSLGWLTTVLTQLWSSGMALVNIISLLIVTPVVAFYMLLDWDKMVVKIDHWLPRIYQPTIRLIVSDINKATAGFVRGQGTLCLILGLFYGLSLTLVGLNFGLLIGLIAGLISFIPYIGSITGLVISIGVALVQFWPDWIPVTIVAGIFVTGQFFEGNILQPKLVGKSVGLHPVWLMFALFAFGSLFGFTGLLIAVPAAAAVGVIVRFGLKQYLESANYKGPMKPQADK